MTTKKNDGDRTVWAAEGFYRISSGDGDLSMHPISQFKGFDRAILLAFARTSGNFSTILSLFCF